MRLSILLTFSLLAISVGNANSQVGYTRIEYGSTFFDRYHKLTKKTRTEKVGYQKFDERSNIIEDGIFLNSIDRTSYSTNYGDTDRVTFRTYDSLDKLIKESEWHYVNNEKKYEVYKTRYYYNGKEQLTKELKQNTSSLSKFSSSKTYYYSDKRIVIIDSVYDFPVNARKENLEAGRDTIKIDSLGRTAEISYYSSDNGFIYRRVYLFDKFNQGETELRYDGEPDKLFLVTNFQYGPDKKLFHYLKIMVGENHTERGKYMYDKEGRLQKIEYHANEELTKYTEYKYINSR